LRTDQGGSLLQETEPTLANERCKVKVWFAVTVRIRVRLRQCVSRQKQESYASLMFDGDRVASYRDCQFRLAEVEARREICLRSQCFWNFDTQTVLHGSPHAVSRTI